MPTGSRLLTEAPILFPPGPGIPASSSYLSVEGALVGTHAVVRG